MPSTPSPHTRYRQAHADGRNGRPLRPGLADLADHDPKIDEAFQYGQYGKSYEEFAKDNPVEEPSRPAPAKARSNPLTHPTVNGIASLGLGLIAGAVVLSVIDYGPNGALMWFRAKFLNNATSVAGSGTPTTSASSSSSATAKLASITKITAAKKKPKASLGKVYSA